MIIYPKHPVVQTKEDKRWISFKDELYNTFINTVKFRYAIITSGNTEVYELYNDYIWIEIYQSLQIKAGNKINGIDINNYKPLITKIQTIINKYYPNIY